MIAFVEEQSHNSVSAMTWQKTTTEKSAAFPVELGNADVVCYKCGKSGHIKARCYANVAAGAKTPSKKASFPKGGDKDQRARRTGFAPTTSGSGNVGAQ